MHVFFVLTGYYFKYLELYKSITEESLRYNNITFSFFVSSHKNENEIEENVKKYLESNGWQIVYFPNIGWDWGCHSQFVTWYSNNQKVIPDYILFLHDDIRIVKKGFIQAFLNRIEEGYKVIGNGMPYTKIKEYASDYPEEIFLLNKNGVNYNGEEIKIIRGSAVFLDYELAKNIFLNLPFQKYGKIDMANRSLRMFASMVAANVGFHKVAYLSNRFFHSDYIIEEMRGKKQGTSFIMRWKLYRLKINIIDYCVRLFVFLRILRINRPKKIKDKIKLNISGGELKFGYLNYSIEKNAPTDIEDLDEDLKHMLNKFNLGEIHFSELNSDSKFTLLKSILRTVKKYSRERVDISIGEKEMNDRYLSVIRSEFPYVKVHEKCFIYLKQKGLIKGSLLVIEKIY